MSRSSFTRPVVFTSCLVAFAMLFASPAMAQRKKAPGASSSSSAPAKKKKKAAAVPGVPPPEEAPAEAAPAPAPAEAAPVPVEAAPEPAPAPPPPVKRAAPPPVAQETPMEPAPPPQRSVRKKRGGIGSARGSADVESEPEDEVPVAKHRRSEPPARRTHRSADADAEAEEDRAAEGRTDSEDKPAEDADAPAAENEPAPDSDAETDVEANKRPRIKPPLLEIGAGLRAYQRHFSYADDPNNELPNYDLNGAPAIGIDVGVYPFKNASGSLSGGFVASFEYTVALGTTYKVPTGEQAGTHSTSAYQYALGVRGNYSFGAWLGNTISAGLDYGFQAFVVDHPPPIQGNANIPGVEYKFFRPNVLGRFVATGNLSIIGSLGYLAVSSAGEIVSADYFRGATSSASGLDLGAGVAYELKMNPKGTVKYLELRPMITFRRYSFKFNPAEDAPYQSTGASDDYIGINLGVATRL